MGAAGRLWALARVLGTRRPQWTDLGQIRASPWSPSGHGALAVGGNTPQIPAQASKPAIPVTLQQLRVVMPVAVGGWYAYKHLDMMYERSGGGDEEWPLLGTWFARQAMHCRNQPLQSRTPPICPS